jgi:hypothetical protein
MALAQKAEQVFFPVYSARALGACRIAFYSLAFALFLPMEFTRMAEIDPSLWYPFSFFLFGAPQPSQAALAALGWAWKALLLLSAAGLFPRFSLFTAAALGTFLLGLRSGFGAVIHNHCMFLLACWVLAFARAADALSLGGSQSPAANEARGAYGWPIFLIRALLTLSFFSAGLAKLAESGIGWASAANFTATLAYADETYRGAVAFPWQVQLNHWLRSQSYLPALFAFGSLALELAAPLALVFRRLRAPILLGLLAMQLGIWAALYLNWMPMVLCYVFWLPSICRTDTRS